eukprot:11726164-Alexandrium_andersonii.AAC.1
MGAAAAGPAELDEEPPSARCAPMTVGAAPLGRICSPAVKVVDSGGATPSSTMSLLPCAGAEESGTADPTAVLPPRM